MKSNCSHLKADLLFGFGEHSYYWKHVSYKHKRLQLEGAPCNPEAWRKEPFSVPMEWKRAFNCLPLGTYTIIIGSRQPRGSPGLVQSLELMVSHPRLYDDGTRG